MASSRLLCRHVKHKRCVLQFVFRGQQGCVHIVCLAVCRDAVTFVHVPEYMVLGNDALLDCGQEFAATHVDALVDCVAVAKYMEIWYRVVVPDKLAPHDNEMGD